MLRPLLGPRAPWPADPPDRRDDAAAAISSLADLEFARAAGTLDPAAYAAARETLEGDALRRSPEPATRAPLRTLTVAAALAGLVAVGIVANLPRAAGDRAPGTNLTGASPRGRTTPEELEARVAREPRDLPTILALAEAYRDDGRASQAAATYQRALAVDRDSVPALNGLALLLYQSGERDGAMVATDRVLALRPRDPDALFLKGLHDYQAQDWRGAIAAWGLFLDVGEFHPAAPMVRPLYEDAKRKVT